jgi:diguanylate cyclase (GGDEF)-like protein
VHITAWVVLHVLLATLAASVAFVFIRAAHRSRWRAPRGGFVLLAAWASCNAVGELLLASWVGHDTWSAANQQSLTIAVIAFAVAVTVGCAGACWWLRATYKTHALVRAGLDAWIAAGSLSALWWGLLFHAGLDNARHPLGLGLVFVAGVLDVTLLAAAMAVMVARTGLARGQVALAALALLGLILRDLGYGAALMGYVGWHGVGVAGTAMAFVLLSIAAFLEPELQPLDPYVQRRWVGRATVPYILATISGVVLAAHVLLGASLGNGTLILALSVVVALLLRMSITITENAALVRELAASEDHYRSLAYHDHLTGLPNRAFLLERLRERLPAPAALMFLDLDGFKHVNDSLGHDAGDAVLKEAARRLNGVVGDEHLVARFGGDEFAVLVGPCDTSGVVPLAQRINAELCEPYVIDGRTLYVTPSTGVAFADPDCDADALIRNADIAMYEAKQQVGDRIEVFQPRLLARSLTRAGISSVLIRRPWDEHFALLFQPVVALDTGSVVAVEALVRGRTAAGVLMTPDGLVKLAETTGHIRPLGRWILTRALEHAAAWRRQGYDIEMAVNLSVAQVMNDDTTQLIEDTLRDADVPASALTLEITEGVLLDDVSAGVERLTALKQLGVRLALDDFGTGFSSLSYLRLLPVDGIKIDRSFVAALDEDRHAKPVLSAVVKLGEELGLTVTAEGIERPTQYRILRDLGCHRGQGFLFSGPLEAAGIAERLEQGLDMGPDTSPDTSVVPSAALVSARSEIRAGMRTDISGNETSLRGA